MQITGMKYGTPILKLAGFPTPEILDSNSTYEEIEQLIHKRGKCVVKPIFYGGAGKKGETGLVKIVSNCADAQKAMHELHFAKHVSHGQDIQSNGVTFEEFIPSDHEIYFSIKTSTATRKASFTLAHNWDIDIGEMPGDMIVEHSFDSITGLKAYHIVDALAELGAPAAIIGSLVKYLPRLWELYNDFGFTTLELNPIRMGKVDARYIPVACNFNARLDQDNPLRKRLNLPEWIFHPDLSGFEAEINEFSTDKEQNDVVAINPKGTVTPFMFGGDVNGAATEALLQKATISSDFGGNPPYEKMYEISKIIYKYWLKQSNVLLIIGGKANDTNIFITFKAMFDALRDYVVENGKQRIYIVVGTEGPNLIKGFTYAVNVLNNFEIPYKFFGHDSSMIEVTQYAMDIDDWMIG